MSFFLGIDLGASALKLSLIDAQAAQIGACSVAITTQSPAPGYAEQDPAHWRNALQTALAQLRATMPDTLDNLRGIAFTGGAHIAVLCDAHDAPLRPAIMWNDQRASAEAQILQAAPEVLETAGNLPNPTWTLPQLCWLAQHEPEILARVARIYFAKDWLRAQLTGDHCTDAGEVTGAMLGNIRTGQWSEHLLARAGIDPSAMPTPVSPFQEVGATGTKAVAFQLPARVPVFQGSIDTTLEWLCCGPPAAGHTSIKLASAGVVSHTTQALAPQPPVSIYPHVTDTLYYHAAGMNNCAGALDWFAHVFAPTHTLDEIAAMAASVAPGADGVLFHPYLLGERAPHWNTDLAASFTGLTRATTRAHLARAVFEGVGHAFAQIWQSMSITTGTDISTLTLLGGGTNSAFWCQMIADMLGLHMQLPERTDAAYGAALLSAYAGGSFETLADAAHAGYQCRAEFSPDKQTHAWYADAQKLYDVAFDRFHRGHDATN
ncbi:MAG TPA: hypothetical protein DIT66_05855 [Rhodobiaceae bacterium]|nr:hypothetical protein [Rhodobiaceae bacterium]